MISNVALQSADAAGAAPSSGETADTGAFDALLALQSLINADAESGVSTQLAGTLEGADALAESQDDGADDCSDDTTGSDDALWFLGASLPTLKVPMAPVTGGASCAAQVQNDPLAVSGSATGAVSSAAQSDTAKDLAQAFSFAGADSAAGDSQSPVTDTKAAATPVIDTTTWNSLSVSADLFAPGARQGNVERVEVGTLTTHVRDPRWVEDLGNRLASMVRTGESSASLQLTPVDLGPLEVNVSVRDNQATVHFGAANADTRALLEASMPRLREMLAAQGFQLMDSSVSHGFARQTRHESAGTPREIDTGEAPTISAQPIHITGLLDLYA
jgi:flagellar hook-length control protein FliK